MEDWYNEDLAYIHDVGFRDYALKSAPGIQDILEQNQIFGGLIVDLGCGSGILAEILDRLGYQVLGIDISSAMIAIAKNRVPKAQFRVASLFSTEIPPCGAVISIGECLNYLFDSHRDHFLDRLFHQVYDALLPGGVFIFDGVVPGQVPEGEIVKSFTEGQDWIVLVEKQEDLSQQVLTRRIITLCQVGELYRRREEVHRQRLFNLATIVQQLQTTGFTVEKMNHYGKFRLPLARIAFVARK